jgi:multidrug efflux pump subunit AcrA (membrane-fusion protein)
MSIGKTLFKPLECQVKKSKIATFAIISLSVLFALFIVISIIPKKKPASEPQGETAAVQTRGEGPRGGGTQGDGTRDGGARGEGTRSDGTRSEGSRSDGTRGDSPRGGGTQEGGTRDGGARGGGAQGGGQRSGSRNATTVRVTPVSPGTIEKSVIINGDVLARNQVTIYPTMSGKLVETLFGIGDRVNRGDVVAMVDPSRPGEVYSRSPVVSTVSGTILQAPFNIGDTLTTQSAIFVVGDLSSLLVETFIPERFVAVIRQGLRAVLWFEAIPGETFNAEVIEINPVLDPASRTMRIRLRFINPDPRIKAGMFATISLVTNRRVNVPVIPRMSVINTYGSWIVFIVDENNMALRREVTLGIDNEESFEVLDGIVMGDRVVSAGQNFLSDGDFVRVVE